MDIYIHRDGQQQGPFTLEQLQGMDLTPDTPVWYEGLADWQPAFRAPATAPLFQPQQPPQPQYQPPQQQYAYNQQPQPLSPAMQRPQNYLVLAILSLICCCMPLGIVAVVYAAQVNSKWDGGDYYGAQRASQRAQLWVILAIVFGVIGGIFTLMFQSALLAGLGL